MAEEPAGQAGEQERRTIRWHDREWVVLDGGQSLAGHGHLMPARIRLIQFADASSPDQPLLEAITSAKPIEELHDTELLDLIARARDVPEYGPPDDSARPGRRIRTGGPRGTDRPRGRR